MTKTMTDRPCAKGHPGLRYSKTGRCVDCAKAQSSSYNKNNRQDITDKDRARRHADREGFNARRRERYAANPERVRTEGREYGRRNRRAAAERHRAWRKANPNKVAMIAARYRAAKLHATPPWLTKEHWDQIREIYETCPPGYHVDHIVPLQGRGVRGLHVPWNLQHLPAAENFAKNNHLIEDLVLPPKK